MGDSTNNRESFTITAYVANKERNVQFIHWLLKAIFLLPCSSNASIVDRVLAEFLIFLCYFILIFAVTSCCLCIFIEEHGNVDMMIIHFGPIICFIMAIMKYSCLVLHINDIRVCIECIEADWEIIKKSEDRAVMLRNAKIGRFVATFIAVFMHSSVQLYNISGCFIKRVVNVGNNSVLIHGLPFPFYNEIIDTRVSPVHEIVIVFECFSAYLVCGITIAGCSLMLIFVMHACGQLKILTIWLGDIIPVDAVIDDRTVQRQLGFIVEHHLRVINFVSHIEEVVYLICLVELIGSSFLLCLLGYCSIMAWNDNKQQSIPTYCVISLSFTLNIFIVCYIGEILSEQYRQVGTATYMTNWYHLPPKTALDLLLINLRANFNTSLSAGKMIELSLITFGNVLKTSVTYLNMLRQLTS